MQNVEVALAEDEVARELCAEPSFPVRSQLLLAPNSALHLWGTYLLSIGGKRLDLSLYNLGA